MFTEAEVRNNYKTKQLVQYLKHSDPSSTQFLTFFWPIKFVEKMNLYFKYTGVWKYGGVYKICLTKTKLYLWCLEYICSVSSPLRRHTFSMRSRPYALVKTLAYVLYYKRLHENDKRSNINQNSLTYYHYTNRTLFFTGKQIIQPPKKYPGSHNSKTK